MAKLGLEITNNKIRLYEADRGIIINESSHLKTDGIPEITTIQKGLISEEVALNKKIQEVFKKAAIKKSLFAHHIAISHPLSANDEDKEKYASIIREQGKYQIHFIPTILASLIGADIPLDTKYQLVCHLAHDYCEVAFVQKGKVKESLTISNHEQVITAIKSIIEKLTKIKDFHYKDALLLVCGDKCNDQELQEAIKQYSPVKLLFASDPSCTIIKGLGRAIQYQKQLEI